MQLNVENIPDAANAVVHLNADMPDVAVIAVSLLGSGLLLFVLFVLPVWLLLHYRSRSRHLAALPPIAAPAPALSSDDLKELIRLAERIEYRLDSVETLVSADTPTWKR